MQPPSRAAFRRSLMVRVSHPARAFVFKGLARANVSAKRHEVCGRERIVGARMGLGAQATWQLQASVRWQAL